jgi:hypothetical protein
VALLEIAQSTVYQFPAYLPMHEQSGPEHPIVLSFICTMFGEVLAFVPNWDPSSPMKVRCILVLVTVDPPTLKM